MVIRPVTSSDGTSEPQADRRALPQNKNLFSQSSLQPETDQQSPAQPIAVEWTAPTLFGTVITSLDKTILQANDYFCRLFGYTPEECVDKKLDDLCLSGDEPATIFPVPQDGQTGQYELKCAHKDGKPVYVLLQVTTLPDSGGKPAQLFYQVVDFTERKEFEELLQQRNQELEKANAELERFIYSTSHDLRAPLRSVLGLIYIMQDETNPETLKTYLHMMRSSINRMDSFIHDVVDLSRNSQQDINREKIVLQPLVNEIFDSLRYLPGADRIDFSVAVTEEAIFYSDTNRLKIILSNLISNAIAYHNLRQEQPFVRIHARLRRKYGIIEVADNGRGIQPEHQQKIFNMFYRANDDTKGSGLGLYIVRETVEKLNGDVRLKSKPGAGSTFSIKILNLLE